MGDPRDFQSEFVAACKRAGLHTVKSGDAENFGFVPHPDDIDAQDERLEYLMNHRIKPFQGLPKEAFHLDIERNKEAFERGQYAVELDAAAKASEIPSMASAGMGRGIPAAIRPRPHLSSATPLRELKPFRTGVVVTPKSEIPRTPNPVKAPTHDNFKSVQDALIRELGRPKTDEEKRKWADGVTVAVGNVLSGEVSTKIDAIVTDTYGDENLHRGCYMKEREGHLHVFSNSRSALTAAYAPGEWTRAELR